MERLAPGAFAPAGPRRPWILLVLAICLLIPLATQVAGEERVRIAVVDFDTEAIRHGWRYGWSWTNLSRAAADNLTNELVQSGRFRVIERQQLDQVLAEQNLGDSGRVDASTAARLGKILGVQLVVVGSVIEFSVDEKKARIPQIGKWKWGRGVGGALVTGKAALGARVVDTTTAEILGSFEGSGSHKFAQGEFAGASLGTTWNHGMASKVLSEAVQRLAQQIAARASEIEPSTTRGGLEGKIARVEGLTVYLNLGSADGVRPGDRFQIRGIGDLIRDPDTGEVLGGEETALGTVEVERVIAERLSAARIVAGQGFQVGDRAVMP